MTVRVAPLLPSDRSRSDRVRGASPCDGPGDPLLPSDRSRSDRVRGAAPCDGTLTPLLPSDRSRSDRVRGASPCDGPGGAAGGGEGSEVRSHRPDPPAAAGCSAGPGQHRRVAQGAGVQSQETAAADQDSPEEDERSRGGALSLQDDCYGVSTECFTC